MKARCEIYLNRELPPINKLPVGCFAALCFTDGKGGQYRVQKYRGTVPPYFFSTGTNGTFSKMVPKYRYRGTFLKKYSVFLAFSCLLSIENSALSLSFFGMG